MTKANRSSWKEPSRRHIAGGALSVSIFGAFQKALAAGQTDMSPSPKTRLDLDNAADNLTAFMKIKGSLSEERVTNVVTGRVYGIVEGEPAKPFFGLLGFQINRYKRVSDSAFLNASQYFALYTDLRTGERARFLTNPFTGKTVEPPLSQYGPSTVELTATPKEPENAQAAIQPAKMFPWARIGNKLTMTEQVAAPLPLEVQPDIDLTTYTADWRQVQDTTVTSADSNMSFTAMEHWRDWMEMGSLEGSLLWHVTGHKLTADEDLPPHLISEAMIAAPEMFDPIQPIISH